MKKASLLRGAKTVTDFDLPSTTLIIGQLISTTWTLNDLRSFWVTTKHSQILRLPFSTDNDPGFKLGCLRIRKGMEQITIIVFPKLIHLHDNFCQKSSLGLCELFHGWHLTYLIILNSARTGPLSETSPGPKECPQEPNPKERGRKRETSQEWNAAWVFR